MGGAKYPPAPVSSNSRSARKRMIKQVLAARSAHKHSFCCPLLFENIVCGIIMTFQSTMCVIDDFFNSSLSHNARGLPILQTRRGTSDQVCTIKPHGLPIVFNGDIGAKLQNDF